MIIKSNNITQYIAINHYDHVTENGDAKKRSICCDFTALNVQDS